MTEELTYPWPTPPAAGAAPELAPGLHWLRMPLPFALDHVNLWLIEDADGWTAIDTGIASGKVKSAWQTILHGKRLTRTLATHFHPDHLGLADWLGAPLWMTATEYAAARAIIAEEPGYRFTDMCAFFRLHGLDAARADALAALGNAYARGVPALPPLAQCIGDGDRLQVGAHDWQVIVGKGHSPEHASLYCAALGILIAGDMVLPRITSNVSAFSHRPGEDPLADFLAALDRLAGLPAATLVLPAHGLPFRGLHLRIAQLHEHHAARCAELLDACRAAPRTAAELLPVLFARDITDPHQVRFAMGEAIAHLVHLEKQGRLLREERTGIVRFRSD